MGVNQFAEQIQQAARKIVSEIHTAVPGKIISFNPGTGLATVQPAAKRHIPDGRAVSYPVISGVPVMFPSSGNGLASMTFPVKEGDGCLILFAECSIDDWLQGGESSDPRKFDLTDAICIPGLWNSPLTPALQYPDDVVITNSMAQIRLMPDGNIEINTTEHTVTINGNLHVNGLITSTGG